MGDRGGYFAAPSADSADVDSPAVGRTADGQPTMLRAAAAAAAVGMRLRRQEVLLRYAALFGVSPTRQAGGGGT
eukprot:289255-Chlamydomonas_euryale.AAC.6